MSSENPRSPKTTVRRRPDRGRYDPETIDAILDGTFLCHVGFVHDGHPVVIPMAFGRAGDALYIHGALASRMLTTIVGGAPICVTATLIDGIVLARSAFHSSINYRSVVVFGRAEALTTPEEKERALEIITEHILKGRWAEVRRPEPKELASTAVLRVAIDEASAKIRTGPPLDEEKDHASGAWAGVLPIGVAFGEPQPDPTLAPGITIPASVSARLRDAAASR